MISRCTWQDIELKEPSLQSKIMSWNSSRYSIFLPLEQPFLALSRNICIPGNPLLHFGDRCKSEGFSPGCINARERKESRLFAWPHPFPNSFHSMVLLCTLHLSHPQYLDDFASQFSPWFDTIIVLLHLSKMHLVGSNVKEHLRGLKKNVGCCKMKIHARNSQYTYIICAANIFFLLLIFPPISYYRWEKGFC